MAPWDTAESCASLDADLWCLSQQQTQTNQSGLLHNTQCDHLNITGLWSPALFPFKTTRSSASIVRTEAPMGPSLAGSSHILCPTLQWNRFLLLNPACDPVFCCHGWIGREAALWRGLGFISGGDRQWHMAVWSFKAKQNWSKRKKKPSSALHNKIPILN